MLMSSAMYVDTGVSKHGLKMKSTLHSSTVLSGKVFIKNGQFKIKLNTPRQNVEIISVEYVFRNHSFAFPFPPP